MYRGKEFASAQYGMTFVAVLVLLALCMLGLAIAGPAWSQQAKRDREKELLRVGALYANAIASYRDGSPGSLRHYPRRLEALLLDTRYVGVTRYLRGLYPDPMNVGQSWGLVLDADGSILGVFSQSNDTPIAEGSIKIGATNLPSAKRYSDWKFIAKAAS